MRIHCCSTQREVKTGRLGIREEFMSHSILLINKRLLFILYERNPDAEKTLARSLEELEGAPTPPESDAAG